MLSLLFTYYQPTLALLNFLSSRIPVGERANSSRIVVGSAQTTYTHIPGISYLRCTANKPFLKNSYSGNSTPTPHYVPYQIRVTRVCRVRTFSLSTIVIGNIYIVDLWCTCWFVICMCWFVMCWFVISVCIDLWCVSFWISVTIRPTMGQPTTPKKTSGIFDSRTLFPYQNKISHQWKFCHGLSLVSNLVWWCSICIVCMSAPIQTHQDHVRDQEQLAGNHVKVTSGWDRFRKSTALRQQPCRTEYPSGFTTSDRLKISNIILFYVYL